ncbi:protein-disulfide reductase [Roseateles sp. DAIF2]|uniref:protein-disulfide reductase DsbD family protein n=1 Tax=Roseateles sp. DAIF2 TaxID=2714952 RepID=UPI0018A2F106|nr:thioredoxin family protein [Roseateles sp. DAIF2]QPF72241.1 protein-disulfide reductase [Roseateles sp. DAIF2]
MSSFRFLLCRLALLSLSLLPGLALAQGAVVTTEQVRAELVAQAPEGVEAGKPLWLGLLIKHQPHWHTYWKNPGDSGLPTMLSWELPAGVSAGEIQWPVPQRLPVGPLVNYGYESDLLLAVPLTVGPEFKGETLNIKLRADWLVCKEVCIPESGEFSLKLPAQAATAGHAALFEAARAALPQELAGAKVEAKLQGEGLRLLIDGLPAAWQGKTLQAFPEEAGVFNHASAPQQQWAGAQLQLTLPVSAQRSEGPTRLAVVLRQDDAPGGLRLSYQTAAWPALGEVAAPALQPVEPEAAAAAPTSILLALLLAFAGGLLLNLMPCVFPVLSLKVLGFTAHAGERRVLVAGGLAYTAGVVLSFLALAGLLLVLRAGGAQLGWGFQLQSPLFVAGLALLFGLIGLNLLGVFEIRMVLPGNLAGARAANPVLDHGLTGVLAVAVASPCTAPFMGVALGAALTQPAPLALAIFAALGLGMASPYLAASLWPGLARALPRPGVWMRHFKILMAFPMFATVLWLMWVLGQQVGIDGAVALLGLLLALALAAWVFGATDLKARGRTVLGALSLAILAGTAWWAWPALREAPAAAAQADGASASETWQAWSADKVAQAQAEGRTVLVDFTAAWCVTCQFNKRGTLADAQLVADMRAKNVLLLRADWTRRDAAISQTLNSLGRSGVPVYAVYKPGQAAPQLLPEILSVALVRDALSL